MENISIVMPLLSKSRLFMTHLLKSLFSTKISVFEHFSSQNIYFCTFLVETSTFDAFSLKISTFDSFSPETCLMNCLLNSLLLMTLLVKISHFDPLQSLRLIIFLAKSLLFKTFILKSLF